RCSRPSFLCRPFLLSLHSAAHSHVFPSFPTRRSSDLLLGLRSGTLLPFLSSHELLSNRSLLQREHLYQLTRLSKLALFLLTSYLHQSSSQQYYLRSEEHTSELQSRFDLVCRLLLEKKNFYHIRY